MVHMKESLFSNVPLEWRYISLFTNPSARAGYDTRSIFKWSLTGLNSEFSFSLASCLTKAEEPSLSYYLPIAGGRIIGFIPFPRVLVLCEMQLPWSRIWTCFAVSISYDDNHYTTGSSAERKIYFRWFFLSEYCYDWFQFGLVSLFNGISTVVGYLMPKPFSYKNSSGTI